MLGAGSSEETASDEEDDDDDARYPGETAEQRAARKQAEREMDKMDGVLPLSDNKKSGKKDSASAASGSQNKARQPTTTFNLDSAF